MENNNFRVAFGSYQRRRCGREHRRVKAIAATCVRYLLKDGKISQIEILHVPTNLLTRTQVTMSWLTNNYRFKLTIADTRSQIGSRLADVLKKTDVQSVARNGVLRWGIRLIGEGLKSEILSIYADGACAVGLINTKPVCSVRSWASG